MNANRFKSKKCKSLFWVIVALSFVFLLVYAASWILWQQASEYGSRCLKQGNYLPARMAFKRGIAISGFFSAIDPRAYFSWMALGASFEARREFAEAENAYRVALGLAGQLWGAESNQAAFSTQLLARIYKKQGLYSQAEPLFRAAWIIYRKNLGNDHPTTAAALDYAAWTVACQGRLSSAEVMLKQSLAAYEKCCAANSWLMIAPLTELSAVSEKQGQREQARLWREKAYLASKQGELSSDCYTVVNMKMLADMYARQGDDVQAQELYKRSLQMATRMLAADNLFVADILRSYGRLLKAQGQLAAANRLSAQERQIRQKR